MAAALAITATKTRVGATIALTGDSATTARTIAVTHPNGFLQNVAVTTSGAGAATITVVPGEPGTLSAQVLSAPAPSVIVSTVSATVSPN